MKRKMFSLPVIILVLIFDVIGTHQYEMRIVDEITEVRTVCDFDVGYLLNICTEVMKSAYLSSAVVEHLAGETMGIAKSYSFRQYEEIVSACKCPTKPGIFIVNSPIIPGMKEEVQAVLIEKPVEFKIVRSNGLAGSSSSSSSPSITISKPNLGFVNRLQNLNSDTDSLDGNEVNRPRVNGGARRLVTDDLTIPMRARSATRANASRTARSNGPIRDVSTNSSRSVKTTKSKNSRADGAEGAKNNVRERVEAEDAGFKAPPNNEEPNNRMNADNPPPISSTFDEYFRGPHREMLADIIREKMREVDRNLSAETSSDSYPTSTTGTNLPTKSKRRSNTPLVKLNMSMNVNNHTFKMGNNHHHHHYYGGDNPEDDGGPYDDSYDDDGKGCCSHHHGVDDNEESDTVEKNDGVGGSVGDNKADGSDGQRIKTEEQAGSVKSGSVKSGSVKSGSVKSGSVKSVDRS